MNNSKSCLGVENCIKLVKDLRAHDSNGKNNGLFRSVQKKLLNSIPKENPKEKYIFHSIKLICELNTPIANIRDKKLM